jgi:inorganic pyrophosphatase
MYLSNMISNQSRDYFFRVGDGDPLDVCVLSTRIIAHGDLVLTAVPIGGFRMIDGGEADDKIICVVEGDSLMKAWSDLKDAPAAYVDMIRHYFLTYKLNPAKPDEHPVSIPEVCKFCLVFWTLLLQPPLRNIPTLILLL